MKKTLLTAAIFLTGILLSWTQSPIGTANAGLDFFVNPNSINTNFGYTKLDDTEYIGFRFQPELAFGKFGVGLDVPILFNIENGDLRTEEFEDGAGYLRLISYLRWGRKKQDPVYVKVGTLRGEYLGFGMLMNNYSNSPSYEKRKIGLSFDVLIKERYGIEGIYSDFNRRSFTLLGLRPYYRPLGHTNIPILKTLEAGFSYVIDKDQTPPIGDIRTNTVLMEEPMKAWGLDAGVFLLRTRFIDWTLYTQYGMLQKNDAADNFIFYDDIALNDYNQILDYNSGHGYSIGTAARMNVIFNVFELTARLERHWYDDYFIPHFFDATYEMNKDEKIKSIPYTNGTRGIYASLAADIIDQIIVGGGMMLPDNVSDIRPASVFLNLDIPTLIPSVIVSGKYYRGGISSMSDAIKLDEKSSALLRVAYKINQFFVAGIDYRWSFIVTDDGGYEADKQIMPYVGLHIPLNTQ